LLQVNVKIPGNISPGSAVPVSLQWAVPASRSGVTIAIAGTQIAPDFQPGLGGDARGVRGGEAVTSGRLGVWETGPDWSLKTGQSFIEVVCWTKHSRSDG
jgi:hypothetical protein